MANVSYKELGLVNTKEMFAKAFKGGYAIPAYNFNNMEQMQAIVQAAVETKSPVILQVSKEFLPKSAFLLPGKLIRTEQSFQCHPMNNPLSQQ